MTQMDFPLILKWQYGFGSHHVFLVADSNRLEEIVSLYPKDELIVQEYVEADCEYKIITVGYKSLPLITKYTIHATQKVSDLDRFWGLIGDAGVVLGKLGNDAKPFVDRIREIADIVWQTQSRAEELPSGTSLPSLENKPSDDSEQA